MKFSSRFSEFWAAALAAWLIAWASSTVAGPLDAKAIEDATGAKPVAQPDGVMRVTWARADVPVQVSGAAFPTDGGLTSWAGFQSTRDGAMLMGDTVVFEDEVDAAMSAAFAHGLEVTALHNHFFYDEPKVYFMHIGGHGKVADLGAGVKGVWDAIKEVRRSSPTPRRTFAGEVRSEGKLDADRLGQILKVTPNVRPSGVVRFSVARKGTMHGETIGVSLGLETWATFIGSDERASVDGDFIMTGPEVQPVLKSLRAGGLHIVALHHHMIGETPAFYFLHYWGSGSAPALAQALRAALDVQATVGAAH